MPRQECLLKRNRLQNEGTGRISVPPERQGDAIITVAYSEKGTGGNQQAPCVIVDLLTKAAKRRPDIATGIAICAQCTRVVGIEVVKPLP